MPTLCPALHRLPLCDPRASLCDHSPPSVEREVKAQGRHGLRTTWLFRGRPTGLCLSDHEAPLPPGLRPLLSALLRLGSGVLRLHRPPQGPPGAFCRWVWGRCGGGVGLTDSAALPSQAKLGDEVLDYRDLAALPKSKAIYNIDRPDMISYSPYVSHSAADRQSCSEVWPACGPRALPQGGWHACHTGPAHFQPVWDPRPLFLPSDNLLHAPFRARSGPALAGSRPCGRMCAVHSGSAQALP